MTAVLAASVGLARLMSLPRLDSPSGASYGNRQDEWAIFTHSIGISDRQFAAAVLSQLPLRTKFPTHHARSRLPQSFWLTGSARQNLAAWLLAQVTPISRTVLRLSRARRNDNQIVVARVGKHAVDVRLFNTKTATAIRIGLFRRIYGAKNKPNHPRCLRSTTCLGFSTKMSSVGKRNQARINKRASMYGTTPLN